MIIGTNLVVAGLLALTYLVIIVVLLELLGEGQRAVAPVPVRAQRARVR